MLFCEAMINSLWKNRANVLFASRVRNLSEREIWELDSFQIREVFMIKPHGKRFCGLTGERFCVEYGESAMRDEPVILVSGRHNGERVIIMLLAEGAEMPGLEPAM